jgi:hypothetical protein
MKDNGGIVCPWAGSSEVIWAYGFSVLSADQVDDAVTLLAETNDGYAPTPYEDGTLYTTSMEGNPFTHFFITDGAWYVASTTEILDELRATVP